MRGALCPARGRLTHAHQPTHPTGERQTSRQAAREGARARTGPNASFDLIRRGRVVAPRIVQNRDRVLRDSVGRAREGAAGGGARRRAIVASPAAARRGQRPGPSAAA